MTKEKLKLELAKLIGSRAEEIVVELNKIIESKDLDVEPFLRGVVCQLRAENRFLTRLIEKLK